MKRVDLEGKKWIGGFEWRFIWKGKGEGNATSRKIKKRRLFDCFLRERKLYLVVFLERIYILKKNIYIYIGSVLQ